MLKYYHAAFMLATFLWGGAIGTLNMVISPPPTNDRAILISIVLFIAGFIFLALGFIHGIRHEKLDGKG